MRNGYPIQNADRIVCLEEYAVNNHTMVGKKDNLKCVLCSPEHSNQQVQKKDVGQQHVENQQQTFIFYQSESVALK